MRAVRSDGMTLRGLEKVMFVDIRVRPVTRYVVTRFYNDEASGRGGSESLGEFDCESYALEVAEAVRLSPHLLKQQLAELDKMADAPSAMPADGSPMPQASGQT